MWTALGYKHYILKKEKLEDGCSLYASDFVNLWSKGLRNNEIAAVSKQMNPLIEAPVLKLIEMTLSLFGGNAVTNKILDEKENSISLFLESDLSGFKFHFKVELELQSAEMFFKEITLPFMLLAARLQIREKKLIDIILKKDAEINEYERENGLIKRTHLITKEFNRGDLMEGEIEESNSSFAAIMNNPSTILNIVDVAMFESAKSHKLKQDRIHVEKQTVNLLQDPDHTPSKNEINMKRNKKTDMKTRRNRSKIDLSTGANKKKENYKFNLKL